MGYREQTEALRDAVFLDQCWGAWFDQARRVDAQEVGYPEAGQVATDPQHDRDFALLILQEGALFTAGSVARQVLRNTAIANNPRAVTDGDILYTLNNVVWADMRRIQNPSWV